MAAKPPIHLNRVDPFYASAGRHFDQMMARYGAPIIILNLVKVFLPLVAQFQSKEKTKRESILLDQFTDMVSYLNQFPPQDLKLRYIAWDMARASKSNDQDVITILESIAEEVIKTTGFFHSGPEPFMNAFKRSMYAFRKLMCRFSKEDKVSRVLERRQTGVLRTNCVDCLDRTNAAQFVVAKEALGHQVLLIFKLKIEVVRVGCDC